MAKQTRRRRVVNPTTPGSKALITSASLAAALGGWALLTLRDMRTVTQPARQSAETPARSQISAREIPGLLVLPALDPLPTLIPPPASLKHSGPGGRGQAQVEAPPPLATPIQVATPQLEVPSGTSQPSLRVVKAPPAVKQKPAPIAATRSSR